MNIPINNEWILPQGLPTEHNGGVQERLVKPAADKLPHILTILWDDYGWAEAGWHRNYTIGGIHVPSTKEVQTPTLDSLVRDGMELNRAYVYKCCSPTRSAFQSGRHPYHVNPLNAAMEISNRSDPISGFAGIPRNMTGIATKMAAAGYKTSFFGKWDAGMATLDHTPHGRGYQSGLWYFHHDNDYWSMSYQLKCNRTSMTDLWIKDSNVNVSGRPARGYNSTCTGMNPAGSKPIKCQPGPNGDKWWGGYEDALFEETVLRTIEEHNTSEPLFLFWAPHIAHAPLQVPEKISDEFDFISPTDKPTHQRQRYHAMVKFADAAIANVTAALKKKKMWDDLLIVFMSDNGGWISKNGTAGGNNYPLTGGKYNNWEGGIRSNSFVSGGFLPKSRRGITYNGLVTAWDWYATFASLAGVDATDHRAALAGLPPIDSHDLSAVLLGTRLKSPRKEIPIGAQPALSNLSTAPPCHSYGSSPIYDNPFWELPDGNCTTVTGLIVDEGANGLWKLMTGDEKQYVGTGPHYPNSTTDFDSQDPIFIKHCGNGCLFNLNEDPLEKNNLAESMPEKVATLHKKLEKYEKTAFNPHRGKTDPAACQAAIHKYGGFWGPFIP